MNNSVIKQIVNLLTAFVLIDDGSAITGSIANFGIILFDMLNKAIGNPQSSEAMWTATDIIADDIFAMVEQVITKMREEEIGISGVKFHALLPFYMFRPSRYDVLNREWMYHNSLNGFVQPSRNGTGANVTMDWLAIVGEQVRFYQELTAYNEATLDMANKIAMDIQLDEADLERPSFHWDDSDDYDSYEDYDEYDDYESEYDY